MKMNTYKEFINESLNLDWVEIRHILDDMGSGEFTHHLDPSDPIYAHLPYRFFLCGYPDQLSDPDPEDLETAKDRLLDIGLTLVSIDLPSIYFSIRFLLLETEQFTKLKNNGYKFLDDLDWKDWHLNKYMSGDTIFGVDTNIPKLDTKHSRQIITGQGEISIVWGTTSPFETQDGRYEFWIPSEEDPFILESKVEAECYNIWAQQKERGLSNLFSKMKKFESFNPEKESLGRVLIIHGYGATASDCFYPWLKEELENIGYDVELPELPSPFNPKVDDQVKYIQENYPLKKDIIIAHSLGGCVAMKYLEKTEMKTKSLYLLSSFLNFNFYEGDEDIENLKNIFSWKFYFDNIKSKIDNTYVLYPSLDTSVTKKQALEVAESFGTEVSVLECSDDHFCGVQEPEILNFIKNKEGLNEEN